MQHPNTMLATNSTPNHSGEKTQRRIDYEKRLERATNDKESKKQAASKYPGCNSHYAQGQGGRVWCKDENLVPRLGKLDHDATERCACYEPAFAESKSNFLKVYDGCKPDSSSCDIKVTPG
eukprot:m.43168 g.43168  ORF g.43168 m.43168 type:complete len:121 (+) comp6371_c0_seq2:27-389(+)